MPEETFEFETIADDMAAIEAEPGVNPYGEEPETQQVDDIYYEIASKAIEEYILSAAEASTESEKQSEEATLSVLEDFEMPAALNEVKAVPMLTAVNSVMPEQKAYKLDLDGREVYAWFPAGAELGVTDDGYIYNETGSNIVGIIADSLDAVHINGVNDTVTVTPLLNGSGNNNAYRYGSRVYLTHYIVSGTTLQSTVNYVSSSSLVKRPGAGYGFSSFQLTMFGIGLLLVLILIVRFVRK